MSRQVRPCSVGLHDLGSASGAVAMNVCTQLRRFAATVKIHLSMDGLSRYSRDRLHTMKTEPIGSIPRPLFLIRTIAAFQAGEIKRDVLDDAYANALRD